MPTELDRQRLRQCDHAALRRRVVGHPGAPDWALDDEIVTMRPQPASIMSGTTGLQRVERARQVDPDDPLPFLERHLGERSRRAGARDHDLTGPNSPRTLSRAMSTSPGPRRRRPPIASRRRSELVRGALGCIGIEVEHGDHIATLGEAPADRQPDAGCSPGDDRHPRCRQSLMS